MTNAPINQMWWRKSGLTLVTPEGAAELLRLNLDNRPVSPETVEIYAQTMAEGRWDRTGCLDFRKADGVLVNGQHRLLAVIRARELSPSYPGTWLRLEWEASDLGFQNVDTGRARHDGQLYAMEGRKNASAWAATLNKCLRLDSSPQDNWSIRSSGKIKLDKHAKDKWAADNPDVEYSFETWGCSPKYARHTQCSSSLLATFHYFLARKVGREAADQYMEDVCTWGERVGSVHVARTVVTKLQSLAKRDDDELRFAILVTGWNKWVLNDHGSRVAVPGHSSATPKGHTKVALTFRLPS